LAYAHITTDTVGKGNFDMAFAGCFVECARDD
jgi:hypothetical protein